MVKEEPEDYDDTRISADLIQIQKEANDLTENLITEATNFYKQSQTLNSITESLISEQVLPTLNEYSLTKQISFLALADIYFDRPGQVLSQIVLILYMYGALCVQNILAINSIDVSINFIYCHGITCLND